MHDLSNSRFAFLDFETTGLSPWFGDRICEVGLVLTEGRRIKQTYQSLINPERPLSPAAASTNGLSDPELRTAPRFPEIADTLESLLQDTIIICHNARFDLQFLDSELRRLNREIQIPNLMDTLFIAREHFRFPSNTLMSLADALNVPKAESHRALADALTARGVFFALMDVLIPAGKTLDDFIGIYNSPAWPNDGVQLPTSLSEAINAGKRLLIKYMDKDGEQTERWITPRNVIGLADYLYLQAYCHLRNDERTFRLDRIVDVRVEV